MLFRACSRLFLLALALPAFGDSLAQGIKNFYQVDPQVYRGAQPTSEGIKYLASIGVKTVISLRDSDKRSKAEEQLVTAAGMKYINIPMTGLAAPTEAEISKILAILEGGGGVFLHCKRGADRTGVAIASYRIDHDGWDNARALSEAMARGMSPFQIPREKYILDFRPRIFGTKTSNPVAADSQNTLAATTLH